MWGAIDPRDDLSLAYSMDDEKSRASTYISAATEDKMGEVQYFPPPPQPTPVASEAAEYSEAEAESDQSSIFGSFLKSPLDYIFGGNDDDDVSTIGGFNESFRWDGDASTIATTPTLKRDFKIQQPTIYEDEEDEEDESRASSSKKSASKAPSSHSSGSSSQHDADSGYISEASESDEEDDQESYLQGPSLLSAAGSVGAGSLGAGSLGVGSLGKVSRSLDADSSVKDSSVKDSSVKDSSVKSSLHGASSAKTYGERDFEEKDSFGKDSLGIGSYGQDSLHSSATDDTKSRDTASFFGKTEDDSVVSAAFKSYDNVSKSLHSRGSSTGMTDEDASRSRGFEHEDTSRNFGADQDDVSISLSQAFGTTSAQENDPNEDDNASVRSSRSALWRRNVANNKSWRSTRSARSGLGRSLYSQNAMYSTRSMMPEQPQVIRPAREGGPMMTEGMSGRAVVHVKLDHTDDGTIQNLAYTTPLIDEKYDPRDDYTEEFNDEETIAPGNKVDGFDYYFSRSKLIRRCHTRRCYRINAMILIATAFVCTVCVSIITVISSADSGAGSENAGQSSREMVSLSDLRPPAQIAGVIIPRAIDGNLETWFNAAGDYSASKDDVPYYFHIPLSGAKIASETWGNCLGFTIASDVGKDEASNTTLTSTLIYGTNYVNVDVTTVPGIAHAKKMELVPSSLPDILVSPLFFEVVPNLYDSKHKTKMMITMRHPIDRAVAMLEYKKKMTKKGGFDPAIASMSLEQYALSGFIENNYVVRLLTGKSSGTLSISDLNSCKELLRRKALVGVYEDMENSLKHFERYFGWTPVSIDTVNCQSKYVTDGLNRDSVPQIDTGSSAFALIKQQNVFDLALYDYLRNVLVPYQTEVVSRQAQMHSGGGQTINA